VTTATPNAETARAVQRETGEQRGATPVRNGGDGHVRTQRLRRLGDLAGAKATPAGGTVGFASHACLSAAASAVFSALTWRRSRSISAAPPIGGRALPGVHAVMVQVHASAPRTK